MTLEQVVHRIATNSAFSAAIKQDPQAALRSEGVVLGVQELRSLVAAMKLSEANGRPKAASPWYESQLDQEAGKDPKAASPWYEAQLDPHPA